MPLDLASLANVRQFADAFLAGHDRLDLLINNGGIMAVPYARTVDGFELQLGTNHLGHFALTGRLLPRILATPGARVVTVSSLQHLPGRLVFGDLNFERRRYHPWIAYQQSKLANLAFAFELHRRLSRRGAQALSLAAHPGYAGTALQTKYADHEGTHRIVGFAFNLGSRVIAQSPARGARPQIRAATDPRARGGDYFGPWTELIGPPRRTFSSPLARSERVGRELWRVSCELTGETFGELASA
jgi:NAD(P)-dependent dehydrogenase (short-subunit alcohol dehydrogenase family)